MDQNNPLSEITHKDVFRHLDLVVFQETVRDSKFETYIINITEECARLRHLKDLTSVLLTPLASYARINEYGFVEAPYRVVDKSDPKNPRVTDEVRYYG